MDRKEINQERIEALEVLKPLLEDFINKYDCPHDKLIVTQEGAEFVSGECFIPFEIRD